MGVVKIDRQTSRDGRLYLKRSSSFISHVNEVDHKENKENVCQLDSADDLDLDEIIEAGSEYCMLGDQLCSIPYDLYDLPDLKEVLSVETWNSCLTEDEKYSLSVYLPDMDQHVFWLTMKELLSGQDLYFTSPLKDFFEKLKGGFYPFRVTQFREAHSFLQRKIFLQKLMIYHENMRRTFSDMKKVWKNCRLDATVEDRILVWNLWKERNFSAGIDLTSVPAEAHGEERFAQGASSLENNNVLARRLVGEEIRTPLSIGSTLSTGKNAKGVLKMLVGVDSNNTYRPPLKGVLKIIPKISQAFMPAISDLQMHEGALSSKSPCMLDPQKSVYYPDDSFIPKILCKSAYEGGEIASQHEENLLASVMSSDQSLFTCAKKLEHGKNSPSRKLVRGRYFFPEVSLGMPRPSGEDSEHGERCLGERNSWKDSSSQNINLWLHGSRPLIQMPTYSQMMEASMPSSSHSHSHQHQMMVNNADANEPEIFKPMSEKSKIPTSPCDVRSFPITYKRRKPCKKVDPVNDPVKVATAGAASLYTTAPVDTNLHRMEKPLKIRLKRWSSSAAQLKRGLLEVQHKSLPM